MTWCDVVSHNNDYYIIFWKFSTKTKIKYIQIKNNIEKTIYIKPYINHNKLYYINKL